MSKERATQAVAREFGPTAFIVYRSALESGEWVTCVPEGPLTRSAHDVSNLLREAVGALGEQLAVW